MFRSTNHRFPPACIGWRLQPVPHKSSVAKRQGVVLLWEVALRRRHFVLATLTCACWLGILGYREEDNLITKAIRTEGDQRMAKTTAKKSTVTKTASKKSKAKPKAAAKPSPRASAASVAKYEQTGAPWWKRAPLPDVR